jgi:hypothetical protein
MLLPMVSLVDLCWVSDLPPSSSGLLQSLFTFLPHAYVSGTIQVPRYLSPACTLPPPPPVVLSSPALSQSRVQDSVHCDLPV